MIIIKFNTDTIIAQGHANASSKGNDIYCAGISAILMGAVNWFKQSDIKYEFDDGYYLLQIINKSKSNMLKLDLLKIQLMSLNKSEYQKYLKIVNEGDKRWKEI